MDELFAVIVHVTENNILVIADGNRTELVKMLSTIKEVVPEAKILIVDEDNYNSCKNDIKELNKFLANNM